MRANFEVVYSLSRAPHLRFVELIIEQPHEPGSSHTAVSVTTKSCCPVFGFWRRISATEMGKTSILFRCGFFFFHSAWDNFTRQRPVKYRRSTDHPRNLISSNDIAADASLPSGPKWSGSGIVRNTSSFGWTNPTWATAFPLNGDSASLSSTGEEKPFSERRRQFYASMRSASITSASHQSGNLGVRCQK